MENVYVRGVRDIPFYVLEALHHELEQAGIKSSSDFHDPGSVYWISAKGVRKAGLSSVLGLAIRQNRIEVGLPELIGIIRRSNQNSSENRWFDTLQVGDVVTIARREGDESDYPYEFVDEMTDYVGQSFTIIEIRKNFCLEDEMNCHYYNGDNNCYVLDKVSYNWHSSMFVPTKNIQSIKKIELTDIDISL
jgi:hypothetical protein